MIQYPYDQGIKQTSLEIEKFLLYITIYFDLIIQSCTIWLLSISHSFMIVHDLLDDRRFRQGGNVA